MKRFLSLLLILSLVLSMTVFAYGAEEDSRELEKAITAVKSLVKVDEDFTVFSHSTWKEEYNPVEKGLTIWYLEWYDGENSKNISAQVDENGLLRSFSKYVDKPYSAKPGAMSKAEGDEIAKAFLTKALPEGFKNVKLKDYYSYGQSKTYNYDLYVNNIRVDFITISVAVDSDDKEVTNYYTQNLGALNKLTFPKAEGIIGKDKAAASYIDKIGVDLDYLIYNDYQKRQAFTFPAYLASPANMAVDAITGEVVYYNPYFFGYGGEGGMGSADLSQSQKELSPVEQEAVDTVKGLLDKKDALSLLTGKVHSLSKDKYQDSASLTKDQFSGRYAWGFNFENGYGAVDAKTGEIINFSLYEDYKEVKNGISHETAVKKAEEAVKLYSDSKVDKVVYDKNQSTLTGDNYAYYVVFARVEKDMKVKGNGISVTVSKKDGKILNYYVEWNPLLTFKELEKAVSEEDAFSVFDENSKFGPAYIYTDDKVALAYIFNNPIGYNVDPVTKELKDYRGRLYKDNKKEGYPDIKGKWYEKEVTMLLENGHFLDQDTFNGNASITQEGFLRYLYSDYYYLDQDEFYKALESDGKVKKEEKNPDSTLLRKDAAKFAVRYIGLAKAAEQPQIYQQAFTDYVQKEYKGYAALAKALSIMKGDKRGRFLQNKETTNGEAAVIIYNTLNAQ